jgi:uridine kinase
VKNTHYSEIPIQDILQFIMEHVTPDRSTLVGIDGGAGSGKTTFTHWLAGHIRNTKTPVSIVHTDNFFRPSSERLNKGVPLAVVTDIHWERLRDQVIVPLRSGVMARFQLYDWPEDCLKDWVTIDLGGVTIIDGISALRNELSGYYDLRIWFSCPREVRVSRLLGRGDTSAKEIENWMPSENQYIASHVPEKSAHFVVDSSAGNSAAGGNGWTATRWTLPSIT